MAKRYRPQHVKGGGGSLKVWLVVGLVLVLAILGVGGTWFLYSCRSPGTQLFSETSQGAQYDSAAKTGALSEKEVGELLTGEAFSYRMNQRVSVRGKKANLCIENPAENRYLMKVDLQLNGQSLYQSGLIKPYRYIETVTLSTSLEKGDHAAVALVMAIDPLTQAEISKAEQNITLSVK